MYLWCDMYLLCVLLSDATVPDGDVDLYLWCDMYLWCVLFSDAAVPDGDAHAQSNHHGEHHAALSAHPAGTHQAGPGHLPGQEEGQ